MFTLFATDLYAFKRSIASILCFKFEVYRWNSEIFQNFFQKRNFESYALMQTNVCSVQQCTVWSYAEFQDHHAQRVRIFENVQILG